MVSKHAAEDAAVEAAVEQMQLGGVQQVVQFTEDVKSAIGDGTMTLDSTAGKVRIWHRETGVPSDVLTDQLRAHMKKRFPKNHRMAGELVFSLQPTVEPPRGNVMCLLHPDHPERDYLDSIGLRGKFCYSAHIMSEFDLEGHMAHRHSKEWRIITRSREQQYEEEGRQLLRQQTELLARMGGQTLPSDVPRIFYCPVSGCDRFFDSASGVAMHQRTGHKDASQE